MLPRIRLGLAGGFSVITLTALSGCSSRPAGVGDDVHTMTFAVANGPRSSPFEPPEENDHTFVVDAAAGLDTGCTFRGGGPLEFDVEITRHLGETQC